jgi:hypothetical protein
MESLVTLGAGILLLAHVSYYMAPLVSYPGKWFFTLRAEEGLLSCMDYTVFVQVTGQGE